MRGLAKTTFTLAQMLKSFGLAKTQDSVNKLQYVLQMLMFEHGEIILYKQDPNNDNINTYDNKVDDIIIMNIVNNPNIINFSINKLKW